jgi:hypothetical protein
MLQRRPPSSGCPGSGVFPDRLLLRDQRERERELAPSGGQAVGHAPPSALRRTVAPARASRRQAGAGTAGIATSTDVLRISFIVSLDAASNDPSSKGLGD